MGVVTERKIGQCLINNKAMVIVNVGEEEVINPGCQKALLEVNSTRRVNIYGYRCSLVSLKCINLRCEHCEEE